MANILGTQEFISEHKDHTLHLSLVQLTQNDYSATIDDIGGVLYAVPQQELSLTAIEPGGSYLSCRDCGIEQEINYGEVIDENC